MLANNSEEIAEVEYNKKAEIRKNSRQFPPVYHYAHSEWNWENANAILFS